MKTIGIKLADGSFYPVLKEGSPNERLLQLTTAHNNQTKVMVDLYRSQLASMEDAEYVDSLQIENLIEHPNGEPTLNFTVSIDENNRLSAKMIDSETGLQSNATITLVSRTLEERLLPDEYEIKDPTLDENSTFSLNDVDTEEKSDPVSLTATEENSLFGNDVAGDLNPTDESEGISLEADNPDSGAENAEKLEDYELPVADFSSNVIDDFDAPVEETSVDTDFSDDSTHNFSDKELDDMREKLVAEPAAEETSDLTKDMTESDSLELPEITDFNPLNEPVLEDDALNIDEFDSDTDGDPDDFESFASESIPEESPAEETSLDLDLPDFDNLGNSGTEESSKEETFSANTDLNNSLNFSTEASNEDLNFDLDLPDFNTETSSSDSLTDTSYLDDLDFDDMDESNTSDSMKTAGKGLSFTGLYDKETAMGNSAASFDSDGGKNSRASVIICILCAIICVLATLFVLMVIPQKFNFFSGKKSSEAVDKNAIEITELPDAKEAARKNQAFKQALEDGEDDSLTEAIPSPAPLPPVPQAKEEEVVVIENAEDVIPLPPPVTPEKPKDISYRIKWGDTLWDISDSYYKNPWRYKYIARYNGIKNPDHIVSGTYIQIPAE